MAEPPLAAARTAPAVAQQRLAQTAVLALRLAQAGRRIALLVPGERRGAHGSHEGRATVDRLQPEDEVLVLPVPDDLVRAGGPGDGPQRRGWRARDLRERREGPGLRAGR